MRPLLRARKRKAHAIDRTVEPCHDRKTVLGHTLGRLTRNPLIIALVAGVSVASLELRLPTAIAGTVKLFAMASGALSLFVIGGTLVGLPLNGTGRQIAPIVAGKLALHPAAVFLALVVLDRLGIPLLEPAFRQAALLMAAVPMLSIYTVLAQAYGQEDFTAPAMLATTLVSFFSLNGLLMILHYFAV